MPVNSLPDDLLSIAQIAKSLPTRPNTATVWRWCSRGVRGSVLRTIKVGGRTYVSKADLEVFLAQMNAPARPQSSANHVQAKLEAEKYLAANGL